MAEAPGRDHPAEGGGGDVLEGVGLVHHHHVVVGQRCAAAGQVGTVEVAVDHHHVGVGGPVPGVLGEAGVPVITALRSRALPHADRQ